MKTYTIAQIQAAFAASFWNQFNLVEPDNSTTGTGAYFKGNSAFYLDGERISCASDLTHRDAEYLNKKAQEKGKKPSELYPYTGGNIARVAAKKVLEQQSRIDALEGLLANYAERIDQMQVGDGSNSHDISFDNKEEVA